MFSFALNNLKSRLVRSLLAIIGMATAIMGMVDLYAIAGGLDQMISATVDRVPGLVAMQRGAPIPLFSVLPAEWGNELEQIPGVRAVSSECWARANVIDGKVIVSPPRLLFGTDVEAREKLETSLYRDDVIEGRFLNKQDISSANCVISKPIAEEFEKSVGDTMEVNGFELVVAGVYETGTMILDVAILVDLNTYREMTLSDPRSVSSFYIEQDGTIDDDTLTANIQDHFRGRGPGLWRGSMFSGMGSSGSNPIGSLVNSISQSLSSLGNETEAKSSEGLVNVEEKPKPAEQPKLKKVNNSEEKLSQEDPMEVRLAIDWASRFERFSEDLDVALLLLTSLGVFIAVVSIINTMLMSVTERVTEFGILRANGWTRLDVAKLITCESALLGLFGGMMGCLLGWAGAMVVNAVFDAKLKLYVSSELVLYAMTISVVLGIIGGLYPAWWVTRLTPMNAIRRG